jgi:hypothetical protein
MLDVFFFFICELLNSTPHFLYNVYCTDVYLDFQISQWKKKAGRILVRWVCRAGDWRFASATDPCIDAVHGCNVVEHRRVETACKDEYWWIHLPVVHLSLFEGKIITARKMREDYEAVTWSWSPRTNYKFSLLTVCFSEYESRSWHFLL